jgi:UMF1 family MFS transporter
MNQTQPSKREVWAWAFYDFANSAYGVLFLSLTFPIFFRAVIAGGTNRADFYWGLCIGISSLLAALASPVIGALADRAKNKKELLIGFTLASIAGMAGLAAAPRLGLPATSLLFILTNFAYNASTTIYDSFLQDVSTHHTRGRISGAGWGLSYAGGLLAIVLLSPLYAGGFAGARLGPYLLSFALAAGFFLVFALPAFLFLRSHRHLAQHKVPPWRELPAAVRSLIATLRDWRSHKNILLFLLAFYLLNDGLNSVFAFTSIYMTTTLGLSTGRLTFIFLLIQAIAFPATVLTGRLADRWGAKPVIAASALGWIAALTAFLFQPSFTALIGISVLVGTVIGASQAPARALLAKLVPPHKECQFFGLNGFASKVSASLGPVLFGTISWLTGSQRLGIASILLFFIASLAALRGVREPMPAPRR